MTYVKDVYFYIVVSSGTSPLVNFIKVTSGREDFMVKVSYSGSLIVNIERSILETFISA